MEGPPPNRLESAYKQKLRKRLADRREAAAAAQPYNTGYPPPTPGIMGPAPSGMVQRVSPLGSPLQMLGLVVLL